MLSCCSLLWSLTCSTHVSPLLSPSSRAVQMSSPAKQKSPLHGSCVLYLGVDVLHCCFESSALFCVHQTFIFIVSSGGGAVWSILICLLLFLLCFSLMKLKLFIKRHFYCCGLL